MNADQCYYWHYKRLSLKRSCLITIHKIKLLLISLNIDLAFLK